MISINVSDEAIKLFKAKSENLKELIRKRAVAKLADEIYQNAFNRADAHTQTGVLLSALYNRKKSDLRYEVGIDNKRASYGIFVHNDRSFRHKTNHLAKKACPSKADRQAE